MYQKELKISQQAAREAGQYLKKEFFKYQRGGEKYKSPREMVTRCDQKVEDIIFKHLKRHFPSYGSLSEESGLDSQKNKCSWVVDPLYGTHNFTVHNPIFSVSIALLYQNKIVMAITFMPLLDEMYWAIKNKGSYKNNKKIKISSISKLNKSFINYCHGAGPSNYKKAFQIYEYFHPRTTNIRHFGSTTLELAMVAGGHTDALILPGGKIWDLAAGVLLVREAGGIVTDFKGHQWTPNSKNLVASNKKLHLQILKYVKKFA